MLPAVGPKIAQTALMAKVRDAIWKAHFAQLLAFYRDYAHCRVPWNWSEHPGLADWVAYQRYSRYLGKLSRERIARLNAIGFHWDATRSPGRSQQAWDAHLAELTEFKKHFGHCNVPSRAAGYYQLHRWTVTQRSAHNRRALAPARFKELDRIGFSWKSQKHCQR